MPPIPPDSARWWLKRKIPDDGQRGFERGCQSALGALLSEQNQRYVCLGAPLTHAHIRALCFPLAYEQKAFDIHQLQVSCLACTIQATFANTHNQRIDGQTAGRECL